MLERIKPYLLWVLVAGAGLLVIAVMVWIAKFVWKASAGPEVILPIIIIGGVIILLIVLGLLTSCFSMLSLADAKEALGLPSGSVRAVIAIMLLVLFSIVSIFLYNSVATGRLQSVEVAQEQLAAVRAQVNVVLVVPGSGAGPARVYFRETNAAGDDIAKQLIVLLGTLVTAVASFYFGANSVASAHAAALQSPAAPTLTGVSPSPIKADGQTHELTLTGSNLGRVSAVTLKRSGSADIAATNVRPEDDSKVKARVNLPTGTTVGKWDVVVSDGQKTSTLKEGLEITA